MVRRVIGQIAPLHLIRLCGGLLLLGFLGLLVLVQLPGLPGISFPLQQEWLGAFQWLPDPTFPPETSAGTITNRALVSGGIYLCLLAGLFGVYLTAYSRIAHAVFSDAQARSARRLIVAISVAILGILLFARQIFTSDIFGYAWFGRIWAIYGDNPYVHPPGQYAASDAGSWLTYLFWRDLPCPYGPLWLILAGGIAKLAQLGGDSIANYVIGHRLLADAAHIANIYLVWRIAGKLPGPERAQRRVGTLQVAITLAYAWNPLLLIEFGLSGHNDVLMLTAILLAFLALLGHRWRLGALALALACVIKLTAVVFLPGYLWWLFWYRDNARTARTARSSNAQSSTVTQGMGRVAQALGLIIAIGVAFYLPFWAGPATISVLSNDPAALYFIHSLSTIVNRVAPKTFTGLIRWIPLLISASVGILQTWPACTLPQMLKAWGWTLFILLTVGVAWFWPWYVSWLLIAVCMLGPGRLWNATQLLCVTSLAIYIIGPGLKSVWPDITLWSGLFVMGPPLLYVGFSWRSPAAGFLSVERGHPLDPVT